MWKDTIYTDDTGSYSFNDLMKSQKEIDSMSDKDLEQLNRLVTNWSIEAIRCITQVFSFFEKGQMLEYFYKRYKEMRKDKIEHPMWRAKGAIECILMECQLPIEKFSTGFKITLGNIQKHLIKIEVFF